MKIIIRLEAEIPNKVKPAEVDEWLNREFNCGKTTSKNPLAEIGIKPQRITWRRR